MHVFTSSVLMAQPGDLLEFPEGVMVLVEKILEARPVPAARNREPGCRIVGQRLDSRNRPEPFDQHLRYAALVWIIRPDHETVFLGPPSTT